MRAVTTQPMSVTYTNGDDSCIEIEKENGEVGLFGFEFSVNKSDEHFPAYVRLSEKLKDCETINFTVDYQNSGRDGQLAIKNVEFASFNLFLMQVDWVVAQVSELNDIDSTFFIIPKESEHYPE